MRTALIVSVFAAIFCVSSPAQTATAWPEADKLFHTDPRWLGADAAYSVDLGNHRVLWIFEDTFLANPAALPRSPALGAIPR